MALREDDISKLVGEILARLEGTPEFADVLKGKAAASSAAAAPAPEGGGVFSTVDAAVDAAEKAQTVFQELGLEVRRNIIRAIRKISIAEAERLAKMAREETGMGKWKDKLQKNLLVAVKTPGVEDLTARAYTGDKGLTLVEYAPFGVVAAVTPSTNPVATAAKRIKICFLSSNSAMDHSPVPSFIKASFTWTLVFFSISLTFSASTCCCA